MNCAAFRKEVDTHACKGLGDLLACKGLSEHIRWLFQGVDLVNRNLLGIINITSEMVKSARDLGASELIGIIPANSPRLARRVGLDCQPAGRVLDFDGEQSVCVTISMATKMH